MKKMSDQNEQMASTGLNWLITCIGYILTLLQCIYNLKSHTDLLADPLSVQAIRMKIDIHVYKLKEFAQNSIYAFLSSCDTLPY